MVVINIDTAKDSKEEIKEVIKLLQTLVGENYNSTDTNNVNNINNANTNNLVNNSSNLISNYDSNSFVNIFDSENDEKPSTTTNSGDDSLSVFEMFDSPTPNPNNQDSETENKTNLKDQTAQDILLMLSEEDDEANEANEDNEANNENNKKNKNNRNNRNNENSKNEDDDSAIVELENDDDVSIEIVEYN